MGMDPASFAADTLARAGLTRDGRTGHVHPPLAKGLPGWFWGFLPGPPPETTHHAKVIGYRFAKGKRRVPTLRNSEDLDRAWAWHLARIPERGPHNLVPLLPPVIARAVWAWPLPPDRRDWPEGAEPGGYRTTPPDLDNLKKVLFDALALRGFLVNDSHVAADGGSQKRWCLPGEQPGILVFARTLGNARDEGPMPQPGAADAPWHVLPAPWFLDLDVAAANRDRPRNGLPPLAAPAHVAVKRTHRLMPDPAYDAEAAGLEVGPAPDPADERPTDDTPPARAGRVRRRPNHGGKTR